MLDINWIRNNPAAFDAALLRRGITSKAVDLLKFDQMHRESITLAQKLQTERKKLSREIGTLKKQGKDAANLISAVSEIKKQLIDAENNVQQTENNLKSLLIALPNILDNSVPDGDNESMNVEVRRWGSPTEFDFAAKEHFEIGESLGLMDFEGASNLSGSRFVILSGALARMERALASYMLDIHTNENGYIETNPPALVQDSALFGTGQLPKFSDDLFKTENGLWLIPTAEVPLTNLVANEIITEHELPIRRTAMTWCFRAEAGSAGKDTRGMIRQHQFSKVEMVSISHPNDSDTELERITGCAEKILKNLDIPFRTVLLCSGDTGFSARKTYDIEVWLPGQNRYREISSCSNCGDFQARRMKARYRPENEKDTRFVHTLNGSGLAVGRTLIAILENNQRKDGSVAIPKELVPYMGGLEVIEAKFKS